MKHGTGTATRAFFEPGFAVGGAHLQTRDGETWQLELQQWMGHASLSDQPLLDRCRGTTLDVGCGPGRMTAALASRGVPALGIDVSVLAVDMTRARGGHALLRDVFTFQRGRIGTWRHVLLADGNVGIGGDPVRLLWRCRELLTPDGSILLDLAPPRTGLKIDATRVVADRRPGRWFTWARISGDALAPVAAAAGLAVNDTWASGSGRWQAELVPSSSWPSPLVEESL